MKRLATDILGPEFDAIAVARAEGARRATARREAEEAEERRMLEAAGFGWGVGTVEDRLAAAIVARLKGKRKG